MRLAKFTPARLTLPDHNAEHSYAVYALGEIDQDALCSIANDFNAAVLEAGSIAKQAFADGITFDDVLNVVMQYLPRTGLSAQEMRREILAHLDRLRDARRQDTGTTETTP